MSGKRTGKMVNKTLHDDSVGKNLSLWPPSAAKLRTDFTQNVLIPTLLSSGFLPVYTPDIVSEKIATKYPNLTKQGTFFGENNEWCFGPNKAINHIALSDFRSYNDLPYKVFEIGEVYDERLRNNFGVVLSVFVEADNINEALFNIDINNKDFTISHHTYTVATDKEYIGKDGRKHFAVLVSRTYVFVIG